MNKLEKLETHSISSEEKLKNQLGENSEDFKDLQRLVEESDGNISWEDLGKFTKIENGKVEGIYWNGNLYLRGTRVSSLGKIKKVLGDLILNLTDLGALEEVGGDLHLTYISITSLGKIKKVGGSLDLIGLKTLTDLGELEEVGLKLGVYLTSITSLGKLKKVGGSLDLIGLETLTDLGELEEVGGNLNLRGTSFSIHFQVMGKIQSGKLKVDRNIYYDDFLSYFLKNPYFIRLYNYSNSLGEEAKFDGNFINEFEKTFGKPDKRNEQINEVMYYLLQILLKRYTESLVIKKEEIEQSGSGLTPDLVKNIQEDKVKKDMFFREIFGDKMLNQAYEEVSKNLNK